MEGVTVQTVIRPVDGHWHIRRHRIHTDFPLEGAEGAFAVPKDRPGSRPCDRVRSQLENDACHACAHGSFGSTAIFALKGYEEGRIVVPEANTNLMFPRTVLPTLMAGLPAGDHELVCAVYAAMDDQIPVQIPDYVLLEAETLA